MRPDLYPPLKPTETGMKGRCPRCGQGQLFSGFLTVSDGCSSCGLDYGFADAGDGPAFFVMCFAMLVTVSFAGWMEMSLGAPMWLTIGLTLILLLASSILPLRPLKGLMIAQQYVKNAHQGELSENDTDH